MINVTIGDRTKEAMRTLRIDYYPFNSALLKKHFSVCLNRFHPDKNNGKGDLEKTRAVIKAYKWLRNLSSDCLSSCFDRPSKEKMKSDDLFSLWEKCEVCNGEGKQCVHTFSDRCPECGGRGYFVIVGKRFKRKVVCKKCNGKKFATISEFCTCHKCGGVGEYELDLNNPVIPKGAILF